MFLNDLLGAMAFGVVSALARGFILSQSFREKRSLRAIAPSSTGFMSITNMNYPPPHTHTHIRSS